MWKVIVSDGETKYGPDTTWIDLRARHGLDKLAHAGVYVPPALVLKIEELKATIPLNKVAFYNRALGAYESFGLNRNGDGFEHHWLDKKHDTFVKNAHYFQYHQNKDPALSRGRPVASALNERTDMVDLLIVADMDKCAEQIQALESGRRVPTSMGAKVAFDVCTICDHHARTRDEYCEHVHKLASAPYGMRQVLADGRVCGVMNPDPNFFDISDVLLGAAPESETLLKVASLGPAVSGAELAELVGLISTTKDAAITKRVPGVIDGSPIVRRHLGDFSQHEIDIPGPVLDELGGLGGAIRHTAALGIVLKPEEFAHAAKLSTFRPPSLETILSSEPMPAKILLAALDPGAMERLAPYYAQRTAYMPALYNRLIADVQKTAAAVVKTPNVDFSSDQGCTMYAAYRKTLLETLPDVGGADGHYWTVKCASTCTRLYGQVAKDYVAAAFLVPKEITAANKILDHWNKIAQPMLVTLPITGTMADELGTGTLDQLASQAARRRSGR
jgi:hypothetical protein